MTFYWNWNQNSKANHLQYMTFWFDSFDTLNFQISQAILGSQRVIEVSTGHLKESFEEAQSLYPCL